MCVFVCKEPAGILIAANICIESSCIGYQYLSTKSRKKNKKTKGTVTKRNTIEDEKQKGNIMAIQEEDEAYDNHGNTEK